MRNRLRTFVAAGVLAAIAAVPLFLPHLPSRALAQPAPAPSTPATGGASSSRDLGLPGLTLKLSSGDATDQRTARLAALYVPAGASVSPFLPKGAPFTATFTGNLNLRIRDTVKFTAEGRGAVKLSVGGAVVLESAGDDLSAVTSADVKLVRGKNPIVLEYTSPKDGDAVLRLKWLAKDFPAEPLPPTQLYHDAGGPGAGPHEMFGSFPSIARGIIGTLRCTKCHTLEGQITEESMPELAMDAPDLTEAGARMTAAWMAKWIEDPRAVRRNAAMPPVFHGPTKAKQSRDVAAYLATLGKPATIDLPQGDAAVIAGARLYTSLGCLACHSAPDKPVDEDGARIAHSIVKEKYHPAALRDFLLAPDRHYKWTRMGNFRLTEKQADELTAFLLAKAPAPEAAPFDGDPAAGKAAFESSGCLNCHTGPGTNATKPAPPFAAVLKSGFTKGCVAEDEQARGNGVDFSFLAGLRPAFMMFAMKDPTAGSFHRDDPVTRAERQLSSLQCLNCHARDRATDAWSKFAGEIADIEAALPPAPEGAHEEKFSPDQSRPVLTWIGEKLKPEWTEAFISGDLKYKPRPFLRAVMPAFPTRGKQIAPGFAAEHGFGPKSDDPITPNPELVDIGRKLTGKSGGFACNACHPIGDTPAAAAFEAPAINYAYTRDRLRKSFYDRWVWKPLRIDPSTRMPSFADTTGQTAIKDVYDGDGRKQYEAIWHYLQSGKDIQPPAN